jgi:hypothetical protein
VTESVSLKSRELSPESRFSVTKVQGIAVGKPAVTKVQGIS